jgi:hypothetical protein
MPWTEHVLVVANRTATAPELVELLRERSLRRPTRFTLLLPSDRQSLDVAHARLAAAVADLEAAGLSVTGRVGPSDPVSAVRDTWNPAEHDEIVVATLPGQSSRWLEIGLPRRIERLTGAPVTHVIARPVAAAA